MGVSTGRARIGENGGGGSGDVMAAEGKVVNSTVHVVEDGAIIPRRPTCRFPSAITKGIVKLTNQVREGDIFTESNPHPSRKRDMVDEVELVVKEIPMFELEDITGSAPLPRTREK